MDEDRPAKRQLLAELADGFEERQALDVADRATDLDEDEVEAVIAGLDEFLDRIGDVRNHLHGGAEIVAAPLAGNNVHIEPAGGDVVLPVGGAAGEALIMAEIEVGLGTIVGHEHLPVLIRAHGSGIDVEIGIELSQPHGIAAGLQQCAKCCRCQTFAKRRDHAAGDEDVPRHGTLDIEGVGSARKRKNQASTSSIGSLFGGRHLRPWRRGSGSSRRRLLGWRRPGQTRQNRAAARPRRNRRVLLGAARRGPVEDRPGIAALSRQNGQGNRGDEEGNRQDGGAPGQHIGGAAAREQGTGTAPADAEGTTFGALQQHRHDERDGDQKMNDQQDG
jgi:hypothetical protein